MPKPQPYVRLAVSNPPEEHADEADDWSTTAKDADDLLGFLGTDATRDQIIAVRNKLREATFADDAKHLAEECAVPYALFVTAAAIGLVRKDYTPLIAHHLAHELHLEIGPIRESLTTLQFQYKKAA